MKFFDPKTSRVKFESVGINRAAVELQAVIDDHKPVESAMLLEGQGKFWIFMARGLKPTGGYAVKVTDIKTEILDGGRLRLNVFYRYTDPAPGQCVIQVMTYPTDLVLVKGLEQKPDDVVYTPVK